MLTNLTKHFNQLANWIILFLEIDVVIFLIKLVLTYDVTMSYKVGYLILIMIGRPNMDLCDSLTEQVAFTTRRYFEISFLTVGIIKSYWFFNFKFKFQLIL